MSNRLYIKSSNLSYTSITFCDVTKLSNFSNCNLRLRLSTLISAFCSAGIYPMRLISALLRSLPVVVLATTSCNALAAEAASSGLSNKKSLSAFAHPFDASLSQTVSADPRQGAALMRGLQKHRASMVAEQMSSSFGAAPLPDENIEGPRDAAQPDAYLKPDFFSEKVGRIDDTAVDNHADQHRKGAGTVAGGLALAVPLSQ